MLIPELSSPCFDHTPSPPAFFPAELPHSSSPSRLLVPYFCMVSVSLLPRYVLIRASRCQVSRSVCHPPACHLCLSLRSLFIMISWHREVHVTLHTEPRLSKNTWCENEEGSRSLSKQKNQLTPSVQVPPWDLTKQKTEWSILNIPHKNVRSTRPLPA